VSTRQEATYGFYHGGDPRKFYPDPECCTADELKRHETACKLWNEAEARGETPTQEKCPSGFVFDEKGKCVGHVLSSTYGMGTTVIDIEYDDEKQEGKNER
jgi:hypothetical protein